MEISFKQHLAIYNKKVAKAVNKLNMAYVAILLKKQTSLIHNKFQNFLKITLKSQLVLEGSQKMPLAFDEPKKTNIA